MRFEQIEPPRTFDVGKGGRIKIKHCANIALNDDEQVTFISPDGGEYDVAKKSWGYYATPSLNGRLRRFGLSGVLVKNSANEFYVMLVEDGKEDDFHAYLSTEGQEVVCWLDSAEGLLALKSTTT